MERWNRRILRIVALIWAGWWAFFAWATVANQGFTLTRIVVATLFCLIFLGSVAIAWRREAIGGFLLLLEGLLVLIVYTARFGHLPFSTVVFVLLTMAVPPMVAGLLFLASWQASR